MPRHQLSRRGFLGTVGLTTAALGARDAHAAESPPNVLVIQPDQHRGAIMGCAGDAKAATPSLDRLAAGGMRFSHCTSASPLCSPFRATLQTGLYPHKHGVVKNNIRLDPAFRCFAEVFEEAGYATGYIGKWHLDGGIPKLEGGRGLTPNTVGGFVPAERRQGWQEWHGYEKSHEYFEVWQFGGHGKKVRVEDYDWEPAWHTDVALDFIRRKQQANTPWLYYLAYGPPHVPEQCPDAFLDRFPPEDFALPPDVAGSLPPEKEAELRKTLQMYYAQVAAIDHEVGRLMTALEEMGIADNTIILYTSDHGDKLGSHWKKGNRLRGKAAPYATAFRIPLIVRWPSRIKPGQVTDALVNSVDLTPTLLDLAGLPPIPGMQGISMAPWCLEGEGPRQEALWLGLRGWRAVWDGRYVYARNGGYNHLYDHDTDPYEMHNLLDSPKHKDTQARLHAQLLELAQRADDPMLPELRAQRSRRSGYGIV